ncbi:hypothetical protein [Phaeocystidibacter luteus]|uniref:Uncharacterized protein n=1 Tax=Phaeocystidibacter luteus TaxID=911197 RepID=A0A6N6RLW9_9FLAO|nr:hypothetical protein [Phaeocystidibacter luteus]KAB2814567.1 hypothetical protein F8C67_02170 [Phaeocystidibacter luteus]
MNYYYSYFNIEIHHYLTPIEYLLPMLDLLGIFIMALLFTIITVVFLFNVRTSKSKADDENDHSKKKELSQGARIWLNGMWIFFLVVFAAGSFFIYLQGTLQQKDTWGIVLHLFISFGLLMTLFFNNDQIDYTRKYGFVVAVMMLFSAFSIVHSNRTNELIKIFEEQVHSKYYTYESENFSIESGGDLYYLGESHEYLFMFQLSDSTSIVINKLNGHRSTFKKATSIID